MALEKLGKYELKGVIGRGAAGIVYDARDPAIGRRVAIKTVKLPNADDEETLEELGRFRREAQAAGNMSHPNIVPIYDYGETDEIAYIVMEFIGGGTLRNILKEQKQLPPAEALRVMEQVLAGLQYSHDRGIVHRDIKPDNVMLTSDNTVKIADFGIARIEGGGATVVGTMLGTPAYMSPEQWRGDAHIDARSDIYAAGVMLYHLLTGRRPFEGGSQSAIMHAVLNNDAEAPSEVSVSAPPELDRVVLKAIARDPADRFQSASQFALALKEAVGRIGQGVDDDGDRTVIQSSASRRPAAAAAARVPEKAPAAAAAQGGSKMGLIIAAVAAVVVLAGGGVGWLLLGGGGKPEEKVVTVAPDPAAAARAAATAQAAQAAAEREAAERRAAEQRVAEQKVAEQKQAEQEAAKRAADAAAAKAAGEQAAAKAAADQAAAQAKAANEAAAKAAADQAAARTAANQAAAKAAAERAAAEQAAAKAAADQAAQQKAAADAAAAKAAADQAAAAKAAAEQAAAAKAAADAAASAKAAAERAAAERLAAQQAAEAKAAADRAAADKRAAEEATAAKAAADQAAADKLAADRAAAQAAADQQAAKAAGDARVAADAKAAADARAAADAQAAADAEAKRKAAEQLAALNRPVTPPAPSPRETLAGMPCAAVYGEATQVSLTLHGIVPQENYGALRYAFDQAAASGRNWDVRPVPGLTIYCQVIATLRPALRGLGDVKGVSAQLVPSPKSRTLTLHDSDPIDFTIEGPDFPSVLQVDYVGSDGSISHYMPRRTQPAMAARRLKPNERVRLFDTMPGPAFLLGPPYGTDIVVVIASSEPLNMVRSVDDGDTVVAYTANLRSALDAARRKGVKVSVDLVPVVSVEK